MSALGHDPPEGQFFESLGSAAKRPFAPAHYLRRDFADGHSHSDDERPSVAIGRLIGRWTGLR
jgi:hypothetical protein